MTKIYSLTATTTATKADIRPSKFLKITPSADVQIRLQFSRDTVPEAVLEDYVPLNAFKAPHILKNDEPIQAIWYKTTTGTSTIIVEASDTSFESNETGNLTSVLTAPPAGKTVTEIAFTWTAGGLMETAVFKDSVGAALFTLTFTWNPNSTLQKIVRT
jgi:hypothetical protein